MLRHSTVVIPANAGIQKPLILLDSRVRGNDDSIVSQGFATVPVTTEAVPSQSDAL
jgi:hypothetical protein